MSDPKIKRVLISVTDKTGVADFAKALADEFGAEIISTGGTARALTDAGVKVVAIDDVTGFPEMMDGRVKTLHPRVHGGLLARRDLDSHLAQAAEHGIGLIDMVVVNLYAFEATVAKEGVTYEEAIENIDIGGPSMLRSAAKNHASVAVVTDPASYDDILAELRANDGVTTLATRKQLALAVFRLTSAYDNAIFQWLQKQIAHKGPFDKDKRLFLGEPTILRYGENPHQRAAFYRNAAHSPHANIDPSLHLAAAEQLQGKELSYNNYLDLDAAWAAVREFDEPTVVIVKHLTPCGIASNPDITVAYQDAHDCDSVSAFGGVMAFNREVPAAVVEAILANGQFVEAVVAPAFGAAALDLLTEKPNIRVLATGGINPPGHAIDYRSIEGGLLAMTADSVSEDPATFTVPTKRQPTDKEFADLLFAWKACKSVKSNSILIAVPTAVGAKTVGIGAGQPNRVNSAELAAKQAGELARGAVAASDAFMPFTDSLEVLIAAGVTAVIQPGGSVRDPEVIAAADAADVALVFTGHRHFRH